MINTRHQFSVSNRVVCRSVPLLLDCLSLSRISHITADTPQPSRGGAAGRTHPEGRGAEGDRRRAGAAAGGHFTGNHLQCGRRRPSTYCRLEAGWGGELPGGWVAGDGWELWEGL